MASDQHSNDAIVKVGAEEVVIRNRYETLSIANDVIVGVLFVVGSVLFLREATTTAGTWLFVVGSAQFLLRPCIRLARHVHLRRFGEGRDRTDHGGDF